MKLHIYWKYYLFVVSKLRQFPLSRKDVQFLDIISLLSLLDFRIVICLIPESVSINSLGLEYNSNVPSLKGGWGLTYHHFIKLLPLLIILFEFCSCLLSTFSCSNPLVTSSPQRVRRSSAELLVLLVSFSFANWLLWRCLIYHQSVITTLGFSRCIGAVFAAFIHPVGRDDNLESVTDDSHLQFSVHIGCAAEGRGWVHFN